MLATVRGLMPARFEQCQITVRAFRAALGTPNVLVALRGICARYLHTLPAPLGLRPPVAVGQRGGHRRQQSTGPDPPGREA